MGIWRGGAFYIRFHDSVTRLRYTIVVLGWMPTKPGIVEQLLGRHSLLWQPPKHLAHELQKESFIFPLERRHRVGPECDRSGSDVCAEIRLEGLGSCFSTLWEKNAYLPSRRRVRRKGPLHFHRACLRDFRLEDSISNGSFPLLGGQVLGVEDPVMRSSLPDVTDCCIPLGRYGSV